MIYCMLGEAFLHIFDNNSIKFRKFWANMFFLSTISPLVNQTLNPGKNDAEYTRNLKIQHLYFFGND